MDPIQVSVQNRIPVKAVSRSREFMAVFLPCHPEKGELNVFSCINVKPYTGICLAGYRIASGRVLNRGIKITTMPTKAPKGQR